MLFASMAVTIGGSQYSFGVFVEPIEGQFGWTRTQVNAAMSFSAVAGLSAPLVGHAMDRFGARPVMSISLLLLALSFLLRPFIDHLWQWYALSLVQFLGFPGAAMLPGARLVSVWFPDKRGRMMGVASMGANFGGFTLPQVVGLLTSELSWRWGYALLGSLCAGVGILAFLVVREGPESRPQPLAPPGDAPKIVSVPAIEDNTSYLADVHVGMTVGEAVHSRSFYAVALAVVAGTFTYSAVLTQVIPHLQNEGLSLGRATLFLSLLAIFGMFGKVSFGYLAERFPAKHVMMFSLSVQSLALVALILGPGSAVLWLSVPFFGVALGGMGSVLPLLSQETFGLRNFGVIYGLVNMATVASSLLGPLLMGSIFDATDSYSFAFLTIIGIFVFGAMIVQLSRPLARAGA